MITHFAVRSAIDISSTLRPLLIAKWIEIAIFLIRLSSKREAPIYYLEFWTSNYFGVPCNAPAQHIQNNAHFADKSGCKHFGWHWNQPKRYWSALMTVSIDFSIRLLSVRSDSVVTTPFVLRSSEGHGLFIWNFSTLSDDDISEFSNELFRFSWFPICISR